jgi:AraC-like DNA-binding protein
MDALSEALTAVRMTGAIFFSAECSAPWGFAVPAVRRVSHVLAPGTERLVNYHLVTEGTATVRLDGMPDLAIAAGDVVVLPYGDAHLVFNGSPQTFVDSGATLGRVLDGACDTMRLGGGGEVTRFVCGFFGCERDADRLFLAGLPRLVAVHVRGDPAGGWLEGSIRHLVSEASSGRAGRKVLLSRMAEALFVETLRRYMEELPPEQTGWLAGARDAVVGSALALLHRDPSRPWTLDELATAAGASRSVVAERFARFLGEPPLTYLARWRLRLAARLLETSRQTVVQVAAHVGYESEAAFNRAFKRQFGLPPARYRRQIVSDAASAGGTSRGRRPDRVLEAGIPHRRG